MKAAQWTATAKSPSRPPARHGAGALPTVEMCRLREGPLQASVGKKTKHQTSFWGWKTGWFDGIGWEALKETVLPQRREASEQNPAAGQASAPLRTLAAPFPMDACPTRGGGWRKGAAPRGAAPAGDSPGTGTGSVRAAGARGCGRMRRLQCGRQLRARRGLMQARTPREPALDPGTRCRRRDGEQRDTQPRAALLTLLLAVLQKPANLGELGARAAAAGMCKAVFGARLCGLKLRKGLVLWRCSGQRQESGESGLSQGKAVPGEGGVGVFLARGCTKARISAAILTAKTKSQLPAPQGCCRQLRHLQTAHRCLSPHRRRRGHRTTAPAHPRLSRPRSVFPRFASSKTRKHSADVGLITPACHKFTATGT